MTRLPELISPDALERVQQALDSITRFQSEVSQVAKKFQPQMAAFQQSLEAMRRHPAIKRFHCIKEANTFNHPIYDEFFEGDFTPQEIQSEWESIRDWLLGRFPESMDCDDRKKRFLEYIECQNIGAHVSVCRSVYTEIEALFRDELLLSDPEWVAARDAQKNPSQRRRFQTVETYSLLKNDHLEKKLIDEELLISDIGPYTATFILTLISSFQSFDPASPNTRARQSERHLHCHGWAKTASFQDGLNALLLLDMTYQFIPEMKEKNKERKAATQ
jgi:hypothetical protein